MKKYIYPNLDERYVCFDKKEFEKHQKLLGLRYYLIVAYLFRHLQAFGDVTFNLNSLSTGCGYANAPATEKIYRDLRDMLFELIQNKYIKTSVDIYNMAPSRYFNVYCEPELFFRKKNYVTFNMAEYDKILLMESSVNKAILAGVYLYIKQFIGDVKVNDEKKYIAFPSLNNICGSLNLAKQTVHNALLDLCEAELLYCGGNLYVESDYKKGYFCKTCNVYALKRGHLRDEVIKKELALFYGKPIYRLSEIERKNIIYKKPTDISD